MLCMFYFLKACKCEWGYKSGYDEYLSDYVREEYHTLCAIQWLVADIITLGINLPNTSTIYNGENKTR